MALNPKGRDWSSLVNWDDLGKLYAGFTIAWTIILYSGVAWLVVMRKLPFIRIRNLPLTVAAVSFLHIYLVKILLAYVTNGNFSCSAEFWIMSIYLPFGIALFQANLAQLRSISDQQRKFVDASSARGYGFLRRWHNSSYLTKTYVLIGIGMACQLVITGALYATTPTLQGDWSSYGNLPHAKGQAKCRKSPEWIPSAFWQLFYSWVYGPYILLKIRDIHDTHHWRLQVILSVVSGLPGTPLWLAALYSTAFKVVNRRWVPPMWLAPGIIVMQFVTVFFPIYEALRSRKQYHKTLNILKDWETRREYSQEQLLPGSHSHTSGKPSTVATSAFSLRKAHMRTMAGLEKALAVNPEALLRFAATQDFTAENIAFLLRVQHWRSSCLDTMKQDAPMKDHSRAYAAATEIYMNSVCDKTCNFPINIEGPVRRTLDSLFERAVPESKQQAEEHRNRSFDRPTIVSQVSSDSGDTLCYDIKSILSQTVQTTVVHQNTHAMYPLHPGVSPLGEARAKIPPQFDEHVFDAAERSIKYLVLTNTWQKFVGSRHSDAALEAISR